MRAPAASAMGSYACFDCNLRSYHPKDIALGYCSRCKACMADRNPPVTPASFPPIWVIYDHPRDYPEHYVVRVAYGGWQEARVQLAGTIELARQAALTEGASVRLARFPGEDPVIAETWI
jgi:hypothetical protein